MCGETFLSNQMWNEHSQDCAAAMALLGPRYAPQGISAADTPQGVSVLSTQVGGGHYKDRAIQPIEYIHANGLSFIEGSVVKYITRWRDKGGVADLEKIKHYVDLLIELEGRGATPPQPSPARQ